jgi:hypothetical protein
VLYFVNMTVVLTLASLLCITSDVSDVPVYCVVRPDNMTLNTACSCLPSGLALMGTQILTFHTSQAHDQVQVPLTLGARQVMGASRARPVVRHTPLASTITLALYAWGSMVTVRIYGHGNYQLESGDFLLHDFHEVRMTASCHSVLQSRLSTRLRTHFRLSLLQDLHKLYTRGCSKFEVPPGNLRALRVR